jgi:hypothetical protein
VEEEEKVICETGESACFLPSFFKKSSSFLSSLDFFFLGGLDLFFFPFQKNYLATVARTSVTYP